MLLCFHTCVCSVVAFTVCTLFPSLLTVKVFVRGLPETTTEAALTEFGRAFGEVDSCVVTHDNSGAPRGFGFLWYTTNEAVEKILSAPKEQLQFEGVT